MLISCDVAIIGAGTAGLAAYEAATEAGADAIVLEAGPGGTTCAASGCMPSKLLIAAAEATESVRRLETFGLALEGRLRIDGPAVLARMRRERDRFVAGVMRSTSGIPNDKRLRGHARFLRETRLAVTGNEVTARAVVIATGSRAAVPKPFRALGDLLLTNESVFELPDLPRSLAVVGAGPLGLELAQAFGRLGTKVAVFDQGDAIAGLRDPVAARSAREIIGRELPLHLGTEVEARRVEGGAELSWSGASEGGEVFERVLVAAGRPPNLDGLALRNSGLALDERGTPLFDPETMRCGESAVFIAGDAGHDRPVLHEASDEGAIAGRNAALWPKAESRPRRVPFAVVYTDPEIAMVGPPLPSLAERKPVIGAVDFADSGRARIMGRSAGILRVYADPEDGRLLGGAIVGPEAEHLGHLLAFVVQRGLTADEALALPYYHPTLEESLRGALRKLCGQLRTLPEARAGSMEFGPGS
jgi:dihydrolipoamide dehydrogenase